jgi:hypothetical protein
MRSELGESVDHAMRAAGHAAVGVRAAMGPKVRPMAVRVRSAATDGWGSTKAIIMPLNEAAQAELRQAGKRAQRQARRARKRPKQSKRRWPRMAGFLFSGVAVGAVAAYVMRQRRQRDWEGYDPTEALEAAEPAEAGLTTPPGTEPGGVGRSGDVTGGSPSAGGRSGTGQHSASTVEAAGSDNRRM